MSVANPQFVLYLPTSVLAWQARDPSRRLLETEGTLLFGDISGFTTLVEQRSAVGRQGGEEVTDLLNGIFTELLSVARDEGGDVLKFGGDAFLVMFTGPESTQRGALAAMDMQDVMGEIGGELAMSIGLDTGPIHLHLPGERHRELVVLGAALGGALAAEKVAEAGQVVLGSVATADLPFGMVDPTTFVLQDTPVVSAAPLTEPGLGDVTLDLADYIPESLRPHLTVGGSFGEHRQATIGFLHIGVSPDATPQQTAIDLHEIIILLQEAAARHEVTFLGTDVDPAGCKAVIVAGAPTATRREEERVLRTLHRLIAAGGPLPMRAGVARGVVFAADLGAPFRHSYTVIGDTVNLAARLMGSAAEGELLTTIRVLERSPTRFRTTQLEPITLKGKAKAVAAISLGPIIGVDGVKPAPALPLVGREREREVVRRAIADVHERLGGVVEIVGDAGIGKSRLVTEAREMAIGLDLYTLVCEHYEVNNPYYMAGHLIRGVLGLKPDTPATDALTRLEEVIDQSVPTLRPWLPLFGIPLGVEIPDTPTTADLDPAFRTPRLAEKLLELLSALLDEPTMLVVDDAHWIDPASFYILSRLVAAAAPRPWLFLVARRPEGTWTSAPEASVLELEPLNVDDVGTLLRLAARDHPVSDHDLERLRERSGGHPLFALELLEGFDQGELPDSIEAVIAERIDRLGPRDRQLLRYASVLGSSFTLDLLAESLPTVAMAVEDSETWNRLSDFLELSLFGSVTFRHDLIQAAAYRGLPYRARRELHAAVAEALERRARRHPERHAPVLAFHHHHAENWEAAWRFSLVAAERAQQAYATTEASELYALALGAAEHLPDVDHQQLLITCEALGETAGLAGKPGVAVAAFERAQALAVEGSIDAARLLRRKGALQVNQGEYSTAVTWLQEGLDIVEGDNSAEASVERVELLLALAGARNRLGEYEICADLCHRARAEAERIDHRPGVAHAGFLLLFTNLTLGREDPVDYGSQALDIYRDLGDLKGEGDVWNNLGMASYYRGDWDATVVAWERSREARTRAGDAAGATTSVNNLGEVFSDRGELDRAEEMFRDALRGYEAAGFPTGVALATANLGRVAARRGRQREAVELLERARDLFSNLGAHAFVAETQLRVAEAYAFGAAFEEALSSLADIPAESGVPGLEAVVERIRGVAAWFGSDRHAAQRHLAKSAEMARESAVPYEMALSLELLWQLTGDEEAVTESRTILTTLGAGAAARLPIPPTH